MPAPLCRVLDFNGNILYVVFGNRGLVSTFSLLDVVVDVWVNGVIGLDSALRLDRWRLQVKNLVDAQSFSQYVADVNTWKYADDAAIMVQDDTLDIYVEGDGNLDRENGVPKGAESGLLLTMAEIGVLLHVEMVTQLKCIEGWSEVVYWGGVRLSDFIHVYLFAHGAHGRLSRYVGLEILDCQYYVGLHMDDAMHSQTLLCYEINGQPFFIDHGAFLRLVTPLKYGIKHLKQIGSISFSDARSRDYWTENEYDYDEGY